MTLTMYLVNLKTKLPSFRDLKGLSKKIKLKPAKNKLSSMLLKLAKHQKVISLDKLLKMTNLKMAFLDRHKSSKNQKNKTAKANTVDSVDLIWTLTTKANKKTIKVE